MSAVAVPPDIRSGVSVWVVVGRDTWAAQAAWKTFSGSFPSPPVELFTATGCRINAPAELLPCYRTIRDGDPFAQVGDVDGFATRLEHDLAQHALHEQPGFRVLVTVEEWPDMRADEIAVMADEDIDRVEQTLKRLKEVSLVTEFEQRWSIADQGLVRRARQDRVWVVDARKSTRFPKPGLGQRRRLNRLSLVNELAVRFKSEGVPVVAGWRAKLMLCDVLVPFQGGGPFGTAWTELLFERTKTNRDQIFEMLATFRLSANLSRSTILLVVCLDGKSEELFWGTGKGLQIFTTTVAEAMTGPLVGRETIWRAFGKPVPCQPVSQAKGHAGHRYSSR